MDLGSFPRRDLLPVCLAVAVLVLAARWVWAPGWEGPTFRPRPDALEYAAAAQAVARGDAYVLRVGPEDIRPRYAPGWPLLLAPLAAARVDGRSLWRVTGLFGALQAALLAALAWLGVAVLAPRRDKESGTRLRSAAAVAGVAAGAAWALAPMMVKAGRTLLSDEPAAFAATAALAATGWGLFAPPRPGSRAPVVCAAGGLAAGVAVALRLPSGAILALPLVLLALGAGRLHGWSTTARRLVPWFAAAALLPAASSAVLLASGEPPWPWTAYELWIPGRFASLGNTFGLRFALEGDPHLSSVLPGLRGMSNLELAARTLLGLPMRLSHQTAGLLWPAAGWVAAVGLGMGLLRRRRLDDSGKVPRGSGWIAASVAAWVVAHLVLYGLYFFPAPRFYAPPLAVAAVALAAGGGVLLARPGRLGALAGGLVFLLFAASLVQGFGALRRVPRPDLPDPDVRAAFARWVTLSDAERAGGTVPFDPVEAQALGLLDPATAARIGAWGELPPTIQVRRLRARGALRGPGR